MDNNKKGGRVFVISAPSGSGKTTLCKRLLSDALGLVHSVSVTTRRPRPGEKDGADYHFVSQKKFKYLIRNKAFLEYEENFGQLYGTPKRYIDAMLKEGRSVILSIDVKGAMKVRKAFGKKSILIFVLPPSMKVLKKRLEMRKSDGADDIRRRLAFAKKEISYKGRYDYTVINDRLDTAHRKIRDIIAKELTKPGGKNEGYADRCSHK